MKKFSEAIVTGDLPDIIDPKKKAAIEQGKLGYEPMLPDKDYTHGLASKSYTNAMQKLSRYVPEEDLPKNKNQFFNLLMGMMSTLSNIKDIENLHKEYLELMAVDTVLSLPEFESVKKAVESGDLRIEAVLMDGLIQANPNKMEKDLNKLEMQFPDFESELEFQLADIDQEKLKRRFQNIMTQGAAASYMYLFEYVRGDLSQLAPELPDMYGFMQSVGDMSMWVVPQLVGGVAGEEQVEQDEETGIGVIKAKGIIFPLLIHELVKGIVEYANTHGLAKSPEVQKHVLAAVDKNEHEMYDLMLGPQFWKKLTDALDSNKSNLLFHVYHKIISLDAVDPEVKESFGYFIKEFLSDPVNAKRIVNTFVNEIELALQEYENQQNNQSDTPTFESYNLLLQEALTNMMRMLMAKYSDLKLSEDDMEKWASVDPTGVKGVNLPAFLALLKDQKIKEPNDIKTIIDQTTPTPQKKVKDFDEQLKKYVTKWVDLTEDEKTATKEKYVNSTLPWVLKQIKNGSVIFGEDFPKVKNTLDKFFQYRDSKYWTINKKDLHTFNTYGELAEPVSQLVKNLYGSQISKKMQEKPDAISMGGNGDFELIRILPTTVGQKSLNEYATIGGQQYANWCVSYKPDRNGWYYFANYLKLHEIPGLSDIKQNPRNPPQEIIDDPLYSFYMVASGGYPFVAFEFRSNDFKNIRDDDARHIPEYEKNIKPLIVKYIPKVKNIVDPNISDSPGNKMAAYIEKHPDDIANTILFLIKQKREQYGEAFDLNYTLEDANKYAQTILDSLTARINKAFGEKDSNWRAALGKWVTKEKRTSSNVEIFINTPKIKKELIKILTSGNIKPITDGTQQFKLDELLAARSETFASKNDADNVMGEGTISRLIGSAALAGALIGSPSVIAKVNKQPVEKSTKKFHFEPVVYKNIPKNLGGRLFNLANIRHIPSQTWKGQIGSEKGFVKFSDPEYGVRALYKTINTYNKKYKLNTLRQIINRFAPPSENLTDDYITFVSNQMNIKPDDKINFNDRMVMHNLGKAIIKKETGYDAPDHLVYRGYVRAMYE